MALSHEIAVMNEGRIVQIGSPRDIYERPRNKFVADFVGSTNFIGGTVASAAAGNGRCRVATALGELNVQCVEPLAKDTPVVISVRPEDVELYEAAPPREDGDNVCTGVVEAKVFLGDYLDFQVKVGDFVLLAARPSVAADAGRSTPSTCACGRRNAWRLPEARRRPPSCRLRKLNGRRNSQMAKNAVVSEELANKFKTEKETPYTRWVKAEGLDIIPSFYVQQPAHRRAEALGAARRQRGVPQSRRLAHLERLLRDGNSAGQEPGAAPPALRGDDPGARAAAARPRCGTTPAPASPSSGRTARCSRFRSIAITSISTAPGKEPARYVAVTNAPPVINLYEDIDFIFNTKYDFKDRFAGEPDYFSAKGEQKGFLLATNFVPDAVNIPLITATERGAGGGHIRFNMAKGSMNCAHLAIPDRHLQEGPRPRAGRARHRALRRRLFADVAGRRGAATI